MPESLKEYRAKHVKEHALALGWRVLPFHDASAPDQPVFVLLSPDFHPFSKGKLVRFKIAISVAGNADAPKHCLFTWEVPGHKSEEEAWADLPNRL